MTVESHAVTASHAVYASGMDEVGTSRQQAAVAFLGNLISPHGGSPLSMADRIDGTLSEATPYRVTTTDQGQILANALRGAARVAVDEDGHLRADSLALILPALTAIADGLDNPLSNATPNIETSQALLRLRESLMWLQAASK